MVAFEQLRLWQLAGRTVTFLSWHPATKVYSKAFFRESDKQQHERQCTAQPVAEPEGPPRRKMGKESTTKCQALRLDSRSRERQEKERGRHDSRGRSRRNCRAREAQAHHNKRRARSPKSPSPNPETKGSGLGHPGAAENLPGLHPKAEMPETAPSPAAVKEEPAETRAAEPASVSGTGAQTSAQVRRLSAYEKLLALGLKACKQAKKFCTWGFMGLV